MERLKTFLWGLTIGAGLGTLLIVLITPDSGKNLRLRSRQYYQQVLLESAKAAEARRQELRAQLTALTTLPPENEP